MDLQLLTLPSLSFKRHIKHITVVYNNVIPGENNGKYILADTDTVENVESVVKGLESSGFIVDTFALDEKNIDSLFLIKADVIFNLCYGIGSLPNTEIEAIKLLEKLRIPFTGGSSDVIAFTNDKSATKMKLVEVSVPTPKSQLFLSPDEQIDSRLSFPFILKPNREDCSIGIDATSVVEDKKTFQQKISQLFHNFQMPILGEEYIDGREFHITVLGNGQYVFVLPFTEIVYKENYENEKKWKVYDYDAKWVEGTFSFMNTSEICPVILDSRIEKQIKEGAIKAYAACGCRDYARLDVRLSHENKYYFLEVNMNPSIGELNSAVSKSAKAAGVTYPRLLKALISLAVDRR